MKWRVMNTAIPTPSVEKFERCAFLAGKCAKHGTVLESRRVKQKYWNTGSNGLCQYKYRSVKMWVCSVTKYRLIQSNTPDLTPGEVSKSESDFGLRGRNGKRFRK